MQIQCLCTNLRFFGLPIQCVFVTRVSILIVLTVAFYWNSFRKLHKMLMFIFSLQTFLSGATNVFIYILVNGLHVNTCSLKLMIFILITILNRQHCWCIFKSYFLYMKNDVKLLKIYIVWEYNFCGMFKNILLGFRIIQNFSLAQLNRDRKCVVKTMYIKNRKDVINIFHARSIIISISTFICHLIAVRAI